MLPEFVTVRGHREKVRGEFRVGQRNYWVLENLGGRGREIYRVFDSQGGPQGDLRVLHVLTRGRDTEQRIEIIRRLAQPRRSFPTVVDYFAEPNRILTVFDWTWGKDLGQLLKEIRAGRARRFSPFEAIKRMRPLAHSISEYHHETNLVHGDIKPDNIVVTERPHIFVLIDFGSAWPAERTVGRNSGHGATRPYAAPELLDRASAADFRSDIFSHAVVFYELLTQKIPYEGLGGTAGPQAPPLGSASRLSPDRLRLPARIWRLIDEFLAKGLAIEPNQRFSDRSSWLNAIDEIDLEIRRKHHLNSWTESLVDVVTKFFGPRRKPGE